MIKKITVKKSSRGGYIGILLAVIVLVLSIITTAAVAISVSSLRDTTMLARGQEVYALAESGIDNAVLRILRNPSYTGETNLSIGDGNVTITVTGNNPYTIESTALLSGTTRRIRATLGSVAGVLTLTSWEEI